MVPEQVRDCQCCSNFTCLYIFCFSFLDLSLFYFCFFPVLLSPYLEVFPWLIRRSFNLVLVFLIVSMEISWCLWELLIIRCYILQFFVWWYVACGSWQGAALWWKAINGQLPSGCMWKSTQYLLESTQFWYNESTVAYDRWTPHDCIQEIWWSQACRTESSPTVLVIDSMHLYYREYTKQVVEGHRVPWYGVFLIGYGQMWDNQNCKCSLGFWFQLIRLKPPT